MTGSTLFHILLVLIGFAQAMVPSGQAGEIAGERAGGNREAARHRPQAAEHRHSKPTPRTPLSARPRPRRLPSRSRRCPSCTAASPPIPRLSWPWPARPIALAGWQERPSTSRPIPAIRAGSPVLSIRLPGRSATLDTGISRTSTSPMTPTSYACWSACPTRSDARRGPAPAGRRPICSRTMFSKC